MKVNYIVSKINENNNNIELILESEIADYKNSSLNIKVNGTNHVSLKHKDIYILSNRMKSTIDTMTPKLSDVVSNKLDISTFNFDLQISNNKITVQFCYDSINRKIFVNLINSNQQSSLTFINQLPWLSFNYITDIFLDIVRNWSVLEQNSIISHNITYNYNKESIKNTVAEIPKEEVNIKEEVKHVQNRETTLMDNDIYKDILNFEEENININNVEDDIINKQNNNPVKQPQQTYQPHQMDESIYDMF